MNRWNGWGDETINYPLPAGALTYLQNQLGSGKRPPDASLESVLKKIPVSRLSSHPLVNQDPEIRLRHSRGQSLPDWIALRSGNLDTFPDGVAYPEDDLQVQELLKFAADQRASVIPYGGGTSVVGHITPAQSDRPVLTIDLQRLNKLREFDLTSYLATFDAGANGVQVENALNPLGYTLGHFPQSWEQSTLGGWIATRSSGQQSYHYGRIEDLFAGGHIETPCGPWDLPTLAASAAGPDLRQLVLGSEGRAGIITRATLRVRPLPEKEEFWGVFFPNWKAGMDALRAIAQERLDVSMLRLSNSIETETTLQLSGKQRLLQLANRGLKLLGLAEQRCLMIYSLTGRTSYVHDTHSRVRRIIRDHHGRGANRFIGEEWRKKRFKSPYLRNTLWELGYAIDTLETALPWSKVSTAATEILDCLDQTMAIYHEKILAFGHLSHVYPDGASIYITFIFPRAKFPESTLERWKRLKTAASEVIVAHGGTITHQHGIGLDHARYLEIEKGELGMAVLSSAFKQLDPHSMLNPGKLLPAP